MSVQPSDPRPMMFTENEAERLNDLCERALHLLRTAVLEATEVLATAVELTREARGSCHCSDS